jgi:TonB family protein
MISMKNKFLLFAISILFSICGISQTEEMPSPPTLGAHIPRDTNEVLFFAERMPEFIGEGGFQKYLSANIKYPAIEKESGKSGTVYIGFIVEKDGAVTNVHVVKEVQGAPGFTKEAIRVISAMPNWQPGTMNGKPVRIEITQPIKFMLDDGPAKQTQVMPMSSPSFPGGDAALADYLRKNLKYPAKEKRKHKEGTVVISFMVETDGSITNIEVKSEVKEAPAFTTEAKRLVAAMPPWIPGVANGTVSRVASQVKIEFRL